MQQLHFSGLLTLTHSPHRIDHGSWREGAHWRWTVRSWQDVVGAGRGHSDPAGAALRVRVGVGIEPHVRGDLRLDFDWKLRGEMERGNEVFGTTWTSRSWCDSMQLS